MVEQTKAQTSRYSLDLEDRSLNPALTDFSIRLEKIKYVQDVKLITFKSDL